jgi:hypothetical protein
MIARAVMLAAFAAVPCLSGVGIACSCFSPGSPVLAMTGADVVFAGRVLAGLYAPPRPTTLPSGEEIMVVCSDDMVGWIASVILGAIQWRAMSR